MQNSLVELIRVLVRTPSRAGADSPNAIFAVLKSWLDAHAVPCELLTGQDNRSVALIGRVSGSPGSSTYVLNATVDTVGFGDIQSWTHEPTAAQIDNGWLYGRGSADSKAGVAIFCHILAAFQARARPFQHTLGFVFDADEHTGGFGGIRAFLDHFKGTIAGVMIGYPGSDSIGAGARGFARLTIRICGSAAHSGSSRPSKVNAIIKAAGLVGSIEGQQDELGARVTDQFRLPPKFTVTGIRGGGEFSMVPDLCEVDLDIRLTPTFTADAAIEQVKASLAQIDTQLPAPRASEIIPHSSWPAYQLSSNSTLVAALGDAAEEILGRRPSAKVTGPSNVGNLLAQHGIAATCGFGATFRNAHAPDECIEIASLKPVFRVYQRALERLLG